jgi:hypothetical protein
MALGRREPVEVGRQLRVARTDRLGAVVQRLRVGVGASGAHGQLSVQKGVTAEKAISAWPLWHLHGSSAAAAMLPIRHRIGRTRAIRIRKKAIRNRMKPNECGLDIRRVSKRAKSGNSPHLDEVALNMGEK